MFSKFCYIHQNYLLLYHLLKIYVRLAMLIFCRKISINKPELLKTKGPLLLACNHPNSFLDSIILDTLFDQPVWSLARGDAFKTKFISRLLTALKILPVYRTSEGVENLSENYKTFAACIDHFKQAHVVAIFSEGKCINEWHLRPLKKGTARLAIRAWEEDIPLQVLPIGINYSSFHLFGKNLFLNFGEIISKKDIDFQHGDGLRHQSFNTLLQTQLEQLVYEIDKNDKQKQASLLANAPSMTKKILLTIPALIGWLTHVPLYLPVKKVVWQRTSHNDHFDSVMTSILLLLYPLYLLLIGCLVLFITQYWWIAALALLLPFTAWAYVQLKTQV